MLIGRGSERRSCLGKTNCRTKLESRHGALRAPKCREWSSHHHPHFGAVQRDDGQDNAGPHFRIQATAAGHGTQLISPTIGRGLSTSSRITGVGANSKLNTGSGTEQGHVALSP